MLKKGIVFSVIFIMIAVLALAGCSKNNNAGGSSPAASAGTTAAATPGASAASTPAGNVKATEITLWHMEEPPNRVARFNEIVDGFNKANPTIKVKAQVQSWGDAYTKFPASIKAGNGPDLLFTIPDYTTLIKELGVVQPVDDIVNKLNEKHKFLKASLDPFKYEGKTWSIPIYGMVQVLWYRKDLLSAAGVQPPKTWNELIAAAQKLTSNGKYGIALPASKSMATDQVLYSFLITGGAKSMMDGSNKITFDNPKTVKAYETYKQLLAFSPPDSNTYQWGEPQAQFNSGKAAMAIEKGQYLATFEKDSGRPASDLGVVPIPVADGGEPGSIYYSNGVIMLAKDKAKQDAIATFFDYLFQPDVYWKFINAEPGLFLPVTEDGAKADSYWNDPVISKYKSQVQVLIDTSNKGYLFGFTDGVASKIGKIAGPNFIAQTLEQITAKSKSPADAVKWGQQQMADAAK